MASSREEGRFTWSKCGKTQCKGWVEETGIIWGAIGGWVREELAHSLGPPWLKELEHMLRAIQVPTCLLYQRSRCPWAWRLLATLRFLARFPHLIPAWLCTHLFSPYLKNSFAEVPRGARGRGCCLPLPHCHRELWGRAVPADQAPSLHVELPVRVPISANWCLLSTEVDLLLCNSGKWKQPVLEWIFFSLFFFKCTITTMKSFLALHFIWKLFPCMTALHPCVNFLICH